MAAHLIARFKIALGQPQKIIEKCKNGECLLSIYTHHMSRRQLKQIIHWLLKQEISFISIDELNAVYKDKNIPKGKAIITMDDGWHENAPVLALVEKMKIPICIFLTTGPMKTGDGFWWSYIKKAKALGLRVPNVEELKKLRNIEREQTINEVKKLIKIRRQALRTGVVHTYRNSKWVSFGAHTTHHPILTTCDDQTMEKEIKESQETVSKWIEKPVRYFAYPNGNFGAREIHFLQSINFNLAFTTIPKTIQTKEMNPFKIPRCEILENVSLAENICRATGTWIKHR